MTIMRVPITVHLPTRPSRLFSSLWQHIKKSMGNLVRVYAMYEPFKVFLTLSFPFFVFGLLGILRFVWYYLRVDGGAGKVQSLIIATMLVMIGCNLLSLGIIADLIKKNRMLTEDQLFLLKKHYFENR